ncbi:23S rRNA (adenine(2503)-C(2))-methyltransferase [bacterium TMED181]|nr:23S rRNA (adenine(2503)-C(2))-methyltransferase RlmN [Planctomycetota bacterium]OUW44829.1 MAG: 23S rRNA (adenine(2503)-C(2))-methyltransferase [bacterium TMED181]
MNSSTNPAGHLLDGDPAELDQNLTRWCKDRGLPAYRGRQIREHLFEQRTLLASDMTSLSKTIREDLATDLLAPPVTIDTVLRSTDGTLKFLFRLKDGKSVESVWIPTQDRGTLCVSSQVGCAAGCTFCATGTMKLSRNLTPSEIVGQWHAVDHFTRNEGKVGVTQIVFMGMGEPLHNFGSVSRSLHWLTSPDGFAMSPRRITVSTVGIVPKIPRLIEEHPQIRLAVSLHSAVDETRARIVPIQAKHRLSDLLDTLSKLRHKIRRISLEYVVLPGVNDDVQEALALAAFARKCHGHINLLPFHPFEGAPFRAADEDTVERFREEVCRHYDGQVTARRSRGLDIDGACGQLVLKSGSAVKDEDDQP